ncbi:MAG: sigma-54-dependent Fis family transcriptional regulator [Nitrospinae bacterium]|nr:sigma-54-dependent Fis family transcriptional regulator [Nitrospinota bacterium]
MAAGAWPGSLVIFTCPPDSAASAQGALARGAFGLAPEPARAEVIRPMVERAFEILSLLRENRSLRSERASFREPAGFIGEGDMMRQAKEFIAQAALSGDPVIITGETGTGKSHAAASIHMLSSRREAPLFIVDWSQERAGPVEMKLFGHIVEAPEGRRSHAPGALELASEGAVALRWIDAPSGHIQERLNRFLDTGMARPEGADFEVESGARLFALAEKDDAYCRSLAARPGAVWIDLPPLRNRPEDIPVLARHFLESMRRALGRDECVLEEAALAALVAYPWPGNVRELKNVMERVLMLADAKRPVITAAALAPLLAESGGRAPVFALPGGWAPLEDVEALYVKSALDMCGGNKSRAARLLGISRVTLREKLKRAPAARELSLRG